jgi:hypothetical protein
MERNHSVLYIDLLGTCYDILTKPAPNAETCISKGMILLYSDEKLGINSIDEELEIMHEIVIYDPN